ncbi:MAG: polyphosphate kinase 2 family protein [Brachybacterium sp.]|jgi:PPK2 family polyphosphate:nucleotide phosphotransferase|uniref:polyphosphate kinase 2 family protein n=1 Tax=Brachybacterium sp. TaxID=1891286 RepID=UPI003242EF71
MANSKKKSSKKKSDGSGQEAPRGFPIANDWKGDVQDLDPRATPGFSGKKTEGKEFLLARDAELDELQERLYAAHHGGGEGRSVLLIVQGMDTSGKGGIMRHVVGSVDPQGVEITAFKAPTAEEKKHDFLWRIRPHAPAPGTIGVFDRSHYEDVLIHRVHGWADSKEIRSRYTAINAFERELAAAGTTVVKVMLHISYEEQGSRLMERLERPDKHWKYNPGDVDERQHWDDYMDAYTKALRATSTVGAPWHVIPADRKWYARIAVQQLLIDALTDIDPQWPTADFDVLAEIDRLRGTMGQDESD